MVPPTRVFPCSRAGRRFAAGSAVAAFAHGGRGRFENMVTRVPDSKVPPMWEVAFTSSSKGVQEYVMYTSGTIRGCNQTDTSLQRVNTIQVSTVECGFEHFEPET